MGRIQNAWIQSLPMLWMQRLPGRRNQKLARTKPCCKQNGAIVLWFSERSIWTLYPNAISISIDAKFTVLTVKIGEAYLSIYLYIYLS